MQARLIKDSDNIVKLDGLYDKSGNGQYINDATVTATITTLAGDTVSGQTLPTTLTYVASSNGRYEGTFGDELAIVVGTEYKITIVATDTDGVKRTFKLRAFCSE